MLALLTVLFPVLLALIILTALIRSIARLWLEYRARIALLKQLSENPQNPVSAEDLRLLLSSTALPFPTRQRQDLTVTGTFLAAIGLFSLLIGVTLRVGHVAVGLYIGGITCVGLGVFIAMVVTIIHLITRNYKNKPPKC